MIIKIEKTSPEPLYLQIRSEIIAGIARGELQPGDALPSVRALASDLGINLHTVNKSYAVLRDEGYLVMQGRRVAVIADPQHSADSYTSEHEHHKMEDDLYALALAHRARGGTRADFITCATKQSQKAFCEVKD